MPIKVLILGSSGMAGHVLTVMLRQEPSAYTVIDASRSTSAIDPKLLLDMKNTARLINIINEMRPDIIVNCVGLLNKYAEEHPDEAIFINSYLPHFLETHTAVMGCKIIQISTDCVFSGKKGGYIETDFKDGLGFYAQSKALGEIKNDKNLTIRTSIIGPELKKEGIGLFNWFVQQTDEVLGYSNAYWSGVTTIELARAIKEAIKENMSGVYHLSSPIKISKKDLLFLLQKEFGTKINIRSYGDYKVDKSLINTRSDHTTVVSSYNHMIKEMHRWIVSHKDLYSHYSGKLVS